MNEYIALLKESGVREKKQEYWLCPHGWEAIDILQTGKMEFCRL